MKLTSEIIETIKCMIDAANVAKITNIILEKNLIRGIDDKNTVIIWHNHDIKDLPFEAIGINRLDVFTPRLRLVYDQPNFGVDAVVSERDKSVTQLVMKCQGTKVDYRCANPKIVKAPKAKNDIMRYSAKITPETVQFLTRSEAAMKMDFLTLISNPDGVKFEIVDTNGDVLSHTFDGKAENIEGEEDFAFVCRYPMHLVLSLFKKVTDGIFYVGKRGMLKVTINGIDLYVLPQV
jgi:hypothetical protein